MTNAVLHVGMHWRGSVGTVSSFSLRLSSKICIAKVRLFKYFRDAQYSHQTVPHLLKPELFNIMGVIFLSEIEKDWEGEKHSCLIEFP